ncbi:hypothetical protein CPC08DRAFT_649985 [Agrocybe pediades]|nr:hypothetical protein CPC08DRAFT_649985 [Agrocybe pediades]
MVGGRNKRRVYMAYFHRNPTEKHPVPYHTALYIAPKNPPPASEGNSLLLHAVNPIDRTTNPPRQRWIFQSRDTQRTRLLRGVMLLGKLDNSLSNDDIINIVKQVYVPEGTITESLTWRCRDWVYDAAGILQDQNLVTSIDNIWNKGYAFMQANTLDLEPDQPLPCCNTNGETLVSEIGPMVMRAD